MPYVPNPNDPTEPVGSRPAGTAAEEFRALKALVAGLSIAAAASAGPRQTIQAAILDVNGLNTALTVGAGLRPGLTANSTDPYHLSFANGFSGGKALNSDESINANNSDILGADLSANNTSYLYRTFGVGYNSALVPPDYGYAFDRSRGSLLNFEGNDAAVTTLDDFGNTWTFSGNAQIDTAQFKFGASSLLLDGAADFLESTAFSSLGDGAWEASCWFRCNSVAGTHTAMFSLENAAGFGIMAAVDNNAASPRISTYVSSNGTTNDISATVRGTTVIAVNIWYKIRVVFDPLAGNLKFYLSNNGAAETTEITIASTARICALTRFRIGRNAQGGVGDFNGWIDAFRFVRAATKTTTETPAAAAPTITDYKYHHFSIPKMQMFEVTAASVSAGSNPTLTPVVLLYLGEADTSGAAVTAIRNYAIRGEYISPETTWAVSSVVTLNHNLGIKPTEQRHILRCVTSESNWTVGDEWLLATSDNAANAFTPFVNRSQIGHIFGPAGQTGNNKTSFVRFTPAATNWKYVAIARRGW